MHPALEFTLKAVALLAIVGLAYVAACFAANRKREKCPVCAAKKLRCVQSIRATVLIDGKRAPDSWSYFECEACGAHRKLHRGELSIVADDEWQHYCITLRGKMP